MHPTLRKILLSATILSLSFSAALCEPSTWSMAASDLNGGRVEKLSGPAYYGTLAQSASEVVIEQHILYSTGDSFPLPTFPSDGASASLDEVFWTVSLKFASVCCFGVSAQWSVDFTGNQIEVGTIHGNPYLEFMVTVIALRQDGPTPVVPINFSNLKSLYE